MLNRTLNRSFNCGGALKYTDYWKSYKSCNRTRLAGKRFITTNMEWSQNAKSGKFFVKVKNSTLLNAPLNCLPRQSFESNSSDLSRFLFTVHAIAIIGYSLVTGADFSFYNSSIGLDCCSVMFLQDVFTHFSVSSSIQNGIDR